MNLLSLCFLNTAVASYNMKVNQPQALGCAPAWHSEREGSHHRETFPVFHHHWQEDTNCSSVGLLEDPARWRV